ncbi:stage II sporulation protein D [Ferdinandcohnia sp. SAFN-114]|uniref:stage II sporulation protein D n=1 Tax=Ferdinandcohnia sp. SAFN-114 TaxID=3387275 RepID=UPI003F7E873D
MKLKQPKKQSWAKSSLIFFISFFTIILFVPTLIVMPYNNQAKTVTNQTTQNLSTAENVSIKKEEQDIETSDSPFSVEVFRSKQNVVETLPLEEYVVGVVASEMPISFELEALKAQALAARTFLVYRMLSESKVSVPNNAEITDNHQFHQVYKNKEELADQWGKNYETNIAKIQEAVNSTKGQIITYDGKPIDPSFFSTSNGYTENSEDYWSNSYPYLRSVESPWDKESPKFKNEKTLTIAEVEHALGIQLETNSDIIGEKKLTKSKRVDTIKIGNKEFSGVFVRGKLELASNDFDIEQRDGHLIFTTRGNGHGVGMSQYGANGMAKEGKNYKEIVKHYYQGVEIINLESFTELVMK